MGPISKPGCSARPNSTLGLQFLAAIRVHPLMQVLRWTSIPGNPHLKHNQHVPDFCSLLVQMRTHLVCIPHNSDANYYNLPDPVPMSSGPRAFSAAARLSLMSIPHLTLQNLCDGPHSSASFLIGGSTVKYRDTTNMHLDDKGIIHASLQSTPELCHPETSRQE